MSGSEGQQSPSVVARLTDAMKRPGTGATVVGGVVLGAVVVFGFAEAAVGAGAAYLAYRLFKKQPPPTTPPPPAPPLK